MPCIHLTNVSYTTKCSALNITVHVRLGGLSAKAGCYAVIALANNATFSLTVNRVVAFRTQSANWPRHYRYPQPTWVYRKSIWIVGSSPTWDRIFFTFLCTELRLIFCYYVWWSSRTYWLGHCCWGSSPFSAFNAGCNIIKTIVKLETQITDRNMGVHIFFKYWWFGL